MITNKCVSTMLMPEIGEVFRYSHDRTFDYLTSEDELIKIKIHRSKEQSMSDFRIYIYIKVGNSYIKYDSISPEYNSIISEEVFRKLKLTKLVGASCSAMVNEKATETWFSIEPEDEDGDTSFIVVDTCWTKHSVEIHDGVVYIEGAIPSTCIAISCRSYVSLPGFNCYTDEWDYLIQAVFPTGVDIED